MPAVLDRRRPFTSYFPIGPGGAYSQDGRDFDASGMEIVKPRAPAAMAPAAAPSVVAEDPRIAALLAQSEAQAKQIAELTAALRASSQAAPPPPVPIAAAPQAPAAPAPEAPAVEPAAPVVENAPAMEAVPASAYHGMTDDDMVVLIRTRSKADEDWRGTREEMIDWLLQYDINMAAAEEQESNGMNDPDLAASFSGGR